MSDDGRDLLDAYRDSVEPPPDAKQAGWAALEAAIESGAAMSATPTTSAGSSSKLIALVSAVGVVVIGGLTWFLSHDGTAVPPDEGTASIEAAPVEDALEESSPVVEAPVVESVVDAPVVEIPVVEAPVVETDLPVTRRPRPADPSTLAEELSILRRANAQIRAGDADAALRTLADHTRRFPRGALRDERDVTRAEALCASGDRAGAQRQVQRFLARASGSPLATRAGGICP